MRRSLDQTNELIKLLAIFLALSMIFTVIFAQLPKPAGAQSIGISVSYGPPPIPYYVQPPNPDPNYIWSPGYWAYDPSDGYYWVPGTWVPAPEYGLLWTPGYWAWNGYEFVYNSGYWAPQVGYYGGVNYGYGYYGNGYVGGRWQGRNFAYNTAITNVNRGRVHNVYNNRAVANSRWNRVSYNGGRGGVMAHPTANQLAVARGHHYGPTNTQMQHARIAATNRAAFSSVNRGRPPTAALARPYSSANRPAAYAHTAAAPHAAAAPHMAAAEHRIAPQAHAYAAAPHHAAAPQQHAYAAPHAAAQQHAYAAPQHHAAPVQHAYAAPQHAAAPRTYAAPQQHAYAAPQHMAAPVQHAYAAPQRAAAPQPHAAPAAAAHAAPAAAAHAPGPDERHDR